MNGILPAIALAAGLLLGTAAASLAFEPGSFRDYGMQPSVFGSVPMKARLPQVLERFAAVDFMSAPLCEGDRACLRRALSLDAAAAKAGRAASPLEALKLVNQAVNRSIRYVPDARTADGLDAWASPSATIATGQGDCEDYAILKMDLLLKAGVPAESMAIAVVRIMPLDRYHAILVVDTSEGNMVLDIVGDGVRPADAPSRYMPLYSLSASRSWLHGHKLPERRVEVAAGAGGN